MLFLDKQRLLILRKTRRLKYYQNLLQHAEFLIEHLAAEMKLPQKAITYKSRKPQIIVARAILYRVLYKTGYSLQDIAYVFSKHHTSVLKGIRLSQKLLCNKKKSFINVKTHLSNLEKVNKAYIKSETEKELQELEAHTRAHLGF